MTPSFVARQVCSHCGKRRMCWPWGVRICADGSKKKAGWLCFPCDKAWNGVVLRYFGASRSDAAAKIKVYRW